MINLITN